MPSNIGFIETVAIREVWPAEHKDFTPWLQSNVSELDKVLGIGLTNARREVGAGDFSIDLVAETDVGDVVIENQFGRSDHRHLGQLVTYLADREVQQAIWIVEEGRAEHVKAVQTLNDRGLGRIWMVTMRAIRIGDSAPAPLFAVVAGPSDIEGERPNGPAPLTPAQIQKRDFMTALFAQAREEGIESPFRDLAPSIHGILHKQARGPRLLYRVVVNKRESRVVTTNIGGKWEGALAVLREHRQEIDEAFKVAGLPRPLEWPEQVNAGRWVIRYTVDINYRDAKPDPVKLRELNRASAEMQQAFGPHLQQLDPKLEEGDASEPSAE